MRTEMLNLLPYLRALLFAYRNRVRYPLRWARRRQGRFTSDPRGFQWWVSADEEYYQGPYADRDVAILVAIREGVGNEFNRTPGCQRFYLCEAVQGPVQLHRHVDASDLLERACERIDDEYGGDDGLDWDFWDELQELDLQRRLEATVRAWQRRHRIVVETWGFTVTRSVERYTHVYDPPYVATTQVPGDVALGWSGA